MLKVNFSCGFFASFTAQMFVGEKMSVMPNEKNSTLLHTFFLENSVFLCRLAHFSYPFQGAQISRLQDKNC